MIWMHVAAGFIALGAGAVALSSRKGARLHRKSGQADEIPEPFRDFRLLSIPVVLVLLSLVYWLVRVFVSNRRARMMHASASAGV